jgi:hypothetical protein
VVGCSSGTWFGDLQDWRKSEDEVVWRVIERDRVQNSRCWRRFLVGDGVVGDRSAAV